MKTYKEAYSWGMEMLQNAGIAEFRLDARLLLEGVCNITSTDLLVHGDRQLTTEQEMQYQEQVKKRCDRVPLQHIQGETCFMGLTFLVNEHVLCPRPDTEVLVEEVLPHLHDGMHILDMCTGSGCILLSLLHYSNDCTGAGVDLSREALQVAMENEKRIGAKEQQISWIHGDLFEHVSGKYEIIVSNPPYIPTGEISSLMPEVKDYEPHMALDGREDGLYFYKKIVQEATKYLFGGGMLFFEIGYDQGEAVSLLMKQAGFQYVEIKKDLAGLDRVVYGTWF